MGEMKGCLGVETRQTHREDREREGERQRHRHRQRNRQSERARAVCDSRDLLKGTHVTFGDW